MFLGVAYTGLNDDEEAENSYRRAIEIDPDNMLAWQGLVSFYEKRERLDDMAKIVNDLLPRAAERYVTTKKVIQTMNVCMEIIDTLLSYAVGMAIAWWIT